MSSEKSARMSTMTSEKFFALFFFFVEKEAREIMLFSLSHRVFVFLQPNSLLKPLPHSGLSLKYTNREERQIDQIISETWTETNRYIKRGREPWNCGLVKFLLPLGCGVHTANRPTVCVCVCMCVCFWSSFLMATSICGPTTKRNIYLCAHAQGKEKPESIMCLTVCWPQEYYIIQSLVLTAFIPCF